jgi:hypothetical protein
MCDGMAYSAMEWVAVLANLAFGGASRRVLCLTRSGFEGSGIGFLVWSSSVHQLEGHADGGREVTQ